MLGKPISKKVCHSEKGEERNKAQGTRYKEGSRHKMVQDTRRYKASGLGVFKTIRDSLPHRGKMLGVQNRARKSKVAKQQLLNERCPAR
jgi:hypothetical protein